MNWKVEANMRLDRGMQLTTEETFGSTAKQNATTDTCYSWLPLVLLQGNGISFKYELLWLW